VPVGTVIKDAASDLVLRDLDTAGDQVVVCKGGSGGRGNAPHKEALAGEPGEERDLFLELKLIADVGIVGFPNAGKSTLISRVSKARPRIAGYPFTTKAPVLGIVELSDERRFVICEIPGLIEGAHLGRGLGLKFLRHAQRSRVLIHLVDMAAIDGRDPVEDYKALNKELEFYSSQLAKKPQIIAANKMDSPGAEDNLAGFRASVKNKVYPISAQTGKGVRELLEAACKKVQRE
jgi:GTP-binding protein